MCRPVLRTVVTVVDIVPVVVEPKVLAVEMMPVVVRLGEGVVVLGPYEGARLPTHVRRSRRCDLTRVVTV